MTYLPMTTTMMMMMMMMMMTLMFGPATALTDPNLPDIYYPFGTDVGDSAECDVDDACTANFTIPGGFPFFGVARSTIRVCGNGVVGFDANITSSSYDTLPLDDKSMFAIWGTDLALDVNDGCAYQRRVTDSGTIAAITNDIQNAFGTFQPTWVYLVTFHNATYYDGDDTTPVNSFQAVLATDGTKSFAIYNFGPIGFYKEPESDDETQVGFNAGDGVNYYSLPDSGSPSVVNLATTTNANRPGRWIFRVDPVAVDEEPNYVSCTTNPCFNGGTCNTGSSCSCLEGTSGYFCEIGKVVVDYCASNPCKNGADCISLQSSFKCQCQRGFGGKTCRRKCDRNCRGSSGCDFYGPGKCDTRCVKGYKLLELTNKCRSLRCDGPNSRVYRLKNRRHCGWVNSKKKKQKKNKSLRGRRRG